MSSVDNLCKQFAPRSGPTNHQARSGSKLFDTLMVFLKEFSEKVKFEKNLQTTKSMQHYPAGNEFNHMLWIFVKRVPTTNDFTEDSQKLSFHYKQNTLLIWPSENNKVNSTSSGLFIVF